MKKKLLEIKQYVVDAVCSFLAALVTIVIIVFGTKEEDEDETTGN